MKSLITIIFLAILAISLSGCTIVNERCRHGHACKEVVVTYSQHRPGKPMPRLHNNSRHHRPRHGHPGPKRMFP
jgi:hypothetical protein